MCVLSGLGYNGKNEKGEHQWDACANVRLWLFETTPLFTGTISSFNINTNAWVARYAHAFINLTFIAIGVFQKVFFFLKGWLTVFFLGLIVFMGCRLACVHACFF